MAEKDGLCRQEPVMLKFRISPSTAVESYFAHQCQRNLLYVGVSSDKNTLKALGLNAPDGRGDDTAIHAGQAWERKIAESLLADGVLICKDEKDLLKKFGVEDTITKLKETAEAVRLDSKERYIYQGKLHATDEFCHKNLRFDETLWRGTDPYLKVIMSEPETDFLKIWKAKAEDAGRGYTEGKLYISVIDSKLAKRMKLEHKVQVTMYVRILDTFLREHKIPLNMDDKYGYLWNYGQEKPTAFSISEIDDILDDYFDGILPNTLKALRESEGSGTAKILADQLEVCVGTMCEYCENYKQCRAHLEKEHSVQLLPYLSGYAQRYLKRLELPKKIEDFITCVDDEEVAEALRGNHSWEYILRDDTVLTVQRDAMINEGDPDYEAGRMWRNARSFHMPRWQDIALILTAQKDIGTDRVYALGYRVEYLYEERRGQHTEAAFIAKERSEGSYLRNALEFIASLYGFLREISGEGHSLQAYVMDGYERDNLEELLYDIMPRDTLSEDQQEEVMGLILWLQGERVVTDADSQPISAIAYPIVVLSSELRKLLALPISIAYTMPKLRSALRISVEDAYSMAKDKSDYNDYEYFGLISNAIPAKLINDHWDGKRKDVYVNYGKHLAKRFALEDKIRARLQSGFLISERNEDEAIGKHLLARLKPFVLPGSSRFRQPLLRKWMFQAKYESLLQCHGIREARQQDKEVALDQGTLLEVEYKRTFQKINNGYTNNYYVFYVINSDKIRRTDWFCGLLRSEETESAAAAYEFDDLMNSDVFPSQYDGERLGILNFLEYENKDDGMYITGQSGGRRKQFFGRIVPGQHLYLSERYTDLNTLKIEGLFHKIDSDDTPALLDPANLAAALDGSFDPVKEQILSYSHMEGPKIGFTKSQETAFKHMFENTVTVLQGPPGTGKTDFIARAVITLCRYYHEKGMDLKVLINANSHPAIDNAILGVRDKLNGDTDILLIKADRMEGTDDRGINVIDKRYVRQCIDEAGKPVVLGITNWGCSELQERDTEYEHFDEVTFDLIIIDEASQVRSMDAMLCLDRGRKDIPCRYLLVGDDDQLPPILQGHYEKKQGEPYVYGSIFRFFRDNCLAAGKEDCCLMLEDDFRMNEILLRYSAEKIYGSKYRAFNDEIRTRHLNYPAGSKKATNEEWIKYILDDLQYDSDHKENYWPLVFCCISSADPNRQNRLERRMVTELTKVIKDTIGSGCDPHYFWRGGDDSDGILGIISPHHVHIEKLKNDISDATGMERDELYIGTVDKLQGQQRDAVIVSYGVTDLESAAMESEFLFNRNRLNVSLTRGRAKTIVFFSEILATCPPELLGADDEDVQKGVDFVCGLMPFMQRKEQDTCISSREFTIEENGKMLTVQIYRKRMA